MTPAPTVTHQIVVGELYRQFANYLLGKTCRVFISPFDVRLPEGKEADEEITTVVQPDISVICDQKKLECFEKSGVKEYWIVHPTDKTVMVFSLDDKGNYGKPSVYTREDEINVSLFEDLKIILETVFSQESI